MSQLDSPPLTIPGLRKRRQPRPMRGGVSVILRWALWKWFVVLFVILALLLPATRQMGLQLLARTTSALGFALDTVEIRGLHFLSDDQVLATLDLVDNMPMILIWPGTLQERLTQLPWVENAQIIRAWPDRLIVAIEEKQPLALWQYQQTLNVIDDQGRVIADIDPMAFADLPLVVGAGAAEHAQELIMTLPAAPHVQQRATAAVRVGKRRWDLHLEEGLLIKLPAQDWSIALRSLNLLQDSAGLLDRDLRIIDLRLADRIGLTPNSDDEDENAEEGEALVPPILDEQNL